LRADGSPYRLDVELDLPSGLALQPPVLRTLLEAPAGEPAAVVEIEEQERPLLRLRTGVVGIAPPRGSAVHAAYEVGSGAWGNAPANALAVLEQNTAGPHGVPIWTVVPGVRARNPVPAAGGSDPTPLEDVRRDAPETFVAELRRAVLASDHAVIAGDRPRVQRAAARGRWIGSWQLVTTLVDVDADDAAEELAEIATALDAARMLGTEVIVAAGRPVGLQLTLEICPVPGADPLLVRAQALAALRPGTVANPGVFHHSRLVLGTAVYVSSAVAAVAALPLVDAVAVLEARRLDEPAGSVRTVIAVAADEVAVLDDDPARPQRGRLDVRVQGGR
jgi:predicted phage baseplate assembly protein